MSVHLPAVLSAIGLGAILSLVPLASTYSQSGELAAADGIIRVRSAYAMAETVERLKADISGKGIMIFQSIDQSKLAATSGVELRPSTLLVFGNPALGSQFIAARAEAGLDWPVRLLVSEDANGLVWAIYTDFAWIARRHGITDRQAEFATASRVIASITSSVAAE